MIAAFERVTALPWRREFRSWARSDGVTWVYLFKVLIAAFLTYWLALRVELPQPHTAIITVFIVMQPQSGQVFAKSFYRLLGTLAGSAMMVLLMALFAQNPLPFLGSLALWVGICSAGAARYRNFRAYGFVLAGYTAAMVGLPALAHPEGSFMSAVWRALEITLGILCSTAVSAAYSLASWPRVCAGTFHARHLKPETCASWPRPSVWKGCAASRYSKTRTCADATGGSIA
ncbi:Fusaric acid resistance protein [Pseudomonas amygdali pv. morsprunorum]|uniref:Fusaric acid resistance protein n=1 Tax=Pseudomonas syringae TaxID=317 RepID=A0A2K4WZH1_PSESX|nr:Fusaric acid resistance protein [Pseudomonas amygdali pv. morsprunorum]RMP03093.1 Fusaric acid resistance protein [Pseudomonas amygdali pv. morsprunorum]RMU24927.1 Fusaric acid resistance protein [Pseudomonas amygdali pv. morsprunorum]SOS41289.1 fusaric acid resistance protein [Pseudomonas syringae]SPD80780.1 fusaric acid resistance protein [Pseudomonas syringae]